MFSFFNKTKDDKGLPAGRQGTWVKVSNLVAGVEIAVPEEGPQAQPQHLHWDEIVSIKPVGKEQVYDIEVEGTHNFVGNDIFAHNTYVLKADALTANVPAEVLNADKTSVDIYKLATYALGSEQALAAKFDAEQTEMVSLEARVEALETGAISSEGSVTSPISSTTSMLASAFESFGAFIQKGIAQFNTLVFQRLVAATDSTGASSAGSVAIITGNTVAQINNSLVIPSTKVFVTFNSQITGSWWVSDKAAGSFRVILSEAQQADVSFDYFLVQTEGQIATSTPDGVQGSTLNPNSQGRTLNPSSGSDTSAPVITLLGDNPLHLSIGGTFVEPGVTVADNVDPSAAFGAGGTNPIVTYINGIEQVVSSTTITTASPTTYTITYQATDKAGNKSALAARSVIVGASDSGSQGGSGSEGQGGGQESTDKIAPVVTLKGDAAMQITATSTPFADPGATAVDDTDGSLTPVVSGTVDSLTAGVYTLTYTVTDKAGNHSSVSRVVTVVAPAPVEPAPVEPAPAPVEPAPAA